MFFSELIDFDAMVTKIRAPPRAGQATLRDCVLRNTAPCHFSVQDCIDDRTAATITSTAQEILASAIEGHIAQFATTVKPIDGEFASAAALHGMQISNAVKTAVPGGEKQ